MQRKKRPWMMGGLPLIFLAGCGGDGGGDRDAEDPIQDDPVTDGIQADQTEDDAAVDAPPDVTADDAVDAPPEDAAEEEPAAVCEPEQSPGPEGHRPGMDCLSCHASQDPDIRWTVAGTLYSNAGGDSAVSGATIIIRDAAGKQIRLVTGANGNFFTTEPFTFPLDAAASKCPDHQEMISPADSGSCNSCHDGSSRIHLP